MIVLSILVMLLGFGFVVFWHELGHFLGCRYAGIRVEQFAVGMGQAIVAYRKGLGVRLMGFGKNGWHWGDTLGEYDAMTAKVLMDRGEPPRGPDGQFTPFQRGEAARTLGISETEYRLSWLPIGGYVKPTGQDDLRPTALVAADDPGSFNAAPVGKRMIMISAGVIMNVILAGILFFVLFRFVGFKSMRAEVGDVQSGSPAALVGLRGGDELLELDGHTLHDFTKVLMNVALLPSDETVDLRIRRDGQEQTLKVQARSTLDNNGMLALGLQPAPVLRTARVEDLEPETRQKWPKDAVLQPGERISEVNGKPIEVSDYRTFYEAIQSSYGKPVAVTITADAGGTRTASITPSFSPVFNRGTLQFLGLTPRTQIKTIDPKSPAADKLKPGDVVLSVRRGSDGALVRTPTVQTFIQTIKAAGAADEPLTISVERDGQTIEVADLRATIKLPDRSRGLGVGLEPDVQRATVGGVVENSTAATAGLPAGATIKAIDGEPVATWGDVHRLLVAKTTPGKVQMAVTSERGDETIDLDVAADDLAHLRTVRYGNPIEVLEAATIKRKTENAFTAIGWGVTETRDLILQGYLTLRRVFSGSVPASGMSGPVGIFTAGVGFAQRGPDWFIWFLALISANLAVVNFLPVPILDGWHFLALIKEKITGKPLSEKVQAAAQWVGLVMILGLLLFVTFNDVMRL